MDSTVYIVSGLPRSGTSLMMQMLHRGGMPVLTDNIRTADEDNPRGYFELERVKQTKGDASWVNEARGKAVKLISRLLFDLPDQTAGNARYKVIFMRRNLDEVLRSQRKMLERRGEDTASGNDEDRDDNELKELFVTHLEEVEAWLRSRSDVEVLFVSYNRLIEDPRVGAERINQFLGNMLDVSAMVASVDRELYRNRKD